ncbi:peptidylprolyl isomerase [Cystobacter fuscus]|uniref:peptidylprolyl isomerase n=1 Tax=Cystobacter fuscus TaxID=43 RepID=UPI0009E031C6|nr:peptidylprolyl isomerase [Cystobacter fuscus]
MDSNPKSSPPAKKRAGIPMYTSPARRAAQGGEVQLPPVIAPSLEGLSVTVPAPEPITARRVQERFQELARAHASERMRPRTEGLAWGDEVLVDIAGYSNGRLIPFSVRTDVWLPLAPDPLLPGLYEQWVGHLPGESVLVDIVLGENYPIEALRGQPARFALLIQAAREVKYPDPTNPEFLEALGRGATLEEVMRGVARELQQEAARARFLEGQQRVLEEVAARTQVDIPEELVDEEIRLRWGASEGRSVTKLKFSNKHQEESLQTWLADERTRAEARQRLRISLALGAICKRDGLILTPAKVLEVIQAESTAAGVPLEQATAVFASEPQQHVRITQAAWHLLAVDHVMSKAQVHGAGT